MASKYIMSDEKYSFYLYKEDDFLAYCEGNNFPEYYSAAGWKEVKSFLEFADNAYKISKERFLELAEQQNVPLPEFKED